MLRLFAVSLLACTPLAATPAPVSLKPGQTVVLASFYELRGCLALAAPRLQLTQPPTLGAATVVSSQGNTGGSGGCGYIATPVSQIIYKADKTGRDTVTWTVRYQARDRAPETGSANIVVLP
ncbi:hypothetical protein [Bordetella holmesii]|uniref:hypothetical protein n=1 Tax=Bordetella holmesii TaxID=35814 RepID=UPI00047493D0|nr:hypothetical protein [Bordetella holmesii]SUV94187.1 Uncharacterised protein [Bordetella holmesii]